MNHSQQIFSMVFVSDNQAYEVLKPGKQALQLTSAPIASQFPAVLGFLFFPSFAVWQSFKHHVHQATFCQGYRFRRLYRQ